MKLPIKARVKTGRKMKQENRHFQEFVVLKRALTYFWLKKIFTAVLCAQISILINQQQTQ